MQTIDKQKLNDKAILKSINVIIWPVMWRDMPEKHRISKYWLKETQ